MVLLHVLARLVLLSLTVGTLLALTALLGRLYGPLTSLSNVRVDVMTALVSFERVFEVLDLEAAGDRASGRRPLPAGPVRVEVDGVAFRYPSADEVSLASLESVAAGDRKGGGVVLRDITFEAEPGQLVALVGPSGAGKSTITALVARLYDPSARAPCASTGSTCATRPWQSCATRRHGHPGGPPLPRHHPGQPRATPRPDATDDQVVAALKAAQVWPLVGALPEGLDTVVGDRGHRLSGGEKQRLALARLLLKGPGLIVLDEATAHLDSESEAAVQRALDTALAAARRWSSPTGCPRCAGPTRSSWSTTGASSSGARHRELMRAAGSTTTSTRRSSPTRRPTPG